MRSESSCSRRFPMVLGDTAGATCTRILPWMWPPLLAQSVDLDVRLHYAAFQNLVYGHGNAPLTTAEISDTPINYAQHVQQSVNISIQFLAGLQCDPVQMFEVVQQEYILVGGAWLYPRVNGANTVYLSKYYRYCLKNQNRGSKDRSPERHLIVEHRDK